MNGDWDKVRDLQNGQPERVHGDLDEHKRRVRHAAWGDNVLFALGSLMLAAVVIGVTVRLVF